MPLEGEGITATPERPRSTNTDVGSGTDSPVPVGISPRRSNTEVPPASTRNRPSAESASGNGAPRDYENNQPISSRSERNTQAEPENAPRTEDSPVREAANQQRVANKNQSQKDSELSTDNQLRDNRPAGSSVGTKQSSKDIDELYRQAEVAQVELSDATQKIADQLGGEALIPPKLKGRDRAIEKINADYNGDASQITDLARSSIVFDDPRKVQEALEQMQSQFNVVRVKDRFENPVNGYR